MTPYVEALTEAMTMLAQDVRTVFLGQSVVYGGTAMHQTLAGVPDHKRIEMPVAESLQLGMSIGMAMAGQIPISVFPRWNFLVLATDQIVNHLDKLQDMGWGPAKVIIRVGVGSEHPLHPGPQHTGDFTEAFQAMTRRIEFIYLGSAGLVMTGYKRAMNRRGPTVLVEVMDLYG